MHVFVVHQRFFKTLKDLIEIFGDSAKKRAERKHGHHPLLSQNLLAKENGWANERADLKYVK